MRRIIVLATATFFVLSNCLLWAADTTETFDRGATDFEFYMGMDGIGLDKYDKAFSGEVVLGYGFIESFSGYLSVSGEANEYFADGRVGTAFGIYGTPVDTDHFDLDLFLDVSISPGELAFTPALEMNVDLVPDLARWGTYLRVEEILAGRDESTEDDPSTPAVDESKTRYAFASMTAFTLGSYWTVVQNHQLLLEYDMALPNNPLEGEKNLDIGGVSLGYNVLFNGSIEMINQVYFDIPQSGEAFAVGFSTGIIVTI